MKIVYIHRQSRPGGFSIENLFHAVAAELREQGETVIEYELGPRHRLWADLMALRALQADIYHVTGDVNYLVLGLPWKKTVLTIHDIGNYLYGLKGWKREVYKWIWLLLPMRLARRVTAVSTATREHVVKYLGFPADRITVIPNCYDPLYRPAPQVFNAACPRILQVGTKPYKNVPALIRALAGISCRLVLIGELDAAILLALQETGVTYENYSGISQAKLLEQYTRADLVTFVSLGEGFGMPIIEAQAIGRPLITANIPPLSVAAGEGACLADPQNVESIRAGMQRLINDAGYREKVVADGRLNVNRYTPTAIAKAYLKVYSGLAVNQPGVIPQEATHD